jgi:anti-sigma B factor antagonist
MANGLFVHDVTVPGCAVLSLCGALDVFTAPVLRAQLAELAARGQFRLVFDLAALSFIDAHGSGVLLAAAVQVYERGGWVRLIGVRRRTYRGLRIRRLIRWLPVYRTLEDALDAPPRHSAAVLVRRFGET